MSDSPVRTQVTTDQGGFWPFRSTSFRERCVPAVSAITYAGAEDARLSPELTAAFADPALRLIVLCPSNPFLSVAPLLAIPELRTALAARRAPAVAICPLVGGAAIKGPTAKLMDELAIAKKRPRPSPAITKGSSMASSSTSKMRSTPKRCGKRGSRLTSRRRSC